MSSIGNFLKKIDPKLFFYGIFSNWGLIILANILGLFFINTLGIDTVKSLSPFIYAILSIGLYFPMPKAHDFRLGYMTGFLIGLIFVLKFYTTTFAIG